MVTKAKEGCGNRREWCVAATGTTAGTLVVLNVLCLDCYQQYHCDDILYFLKMLSWGEQGKENQDISVIFLTVTCESTVSQHNV